MSGLNQIAGSCNCGPPDVTCVTCTGTIPSTLSITDAVWHLHRDVEFHAVALDHTAALLSVVNFSGREMHIRNRGLQQRHPRGRGSSTPTR